MSPVQVQIDPKAALTWQIQQAGSRLNILESRQESLLGLVEQPWPGGSQYDLLWSSVQSYLRSVLMETEFEMNTLRQQITEMKQLLEQMNSPLVVPRMAPSRRPGN